MNDETDPILNALRAAEDRGLLIQELATSLGMKPKKLTDKIEQLVSKGLIKVQKLEQKEEKYRDEYEIFFQICSPIGKQW